MSILKIHSYDFGLKIQQEKTFKVVGCDVKLHIRGVRVLKDHIVFVSDNEFIIKKHLKCYENN